MPSAGGEFAELVETLNLLKEGRPIGGKDKNGLIKQVGGEARNDFSKRVVENTAAGPNSASHSTWLIANYGGGKSETLYEMRDALDESRFGNFRVLACWVDLNIDSSASPDGFQLALFYNGSLLSPHAASSDARRLAKQLLEASPNPSRSTEDIVSVGLDIAMTVLKITAPPGTGVLANNVLGGLWRYYHQRPAHIRKALERLNLGDARATELMIHWVRYSLWPSDATWRALDHYVQGLAQARALFLVMAHVLRVSNYASIVILIDQAEKLIGNRILTDTLANIHAPESSAGLNLFFVFAGTAEVRGLRSEVEYGGFYRRFLDPAQCSSVETDLESPQIHAGRGDDIERIRVALEQIRQKHADIPIPTLDDVRIAEIRQNLMLQAAKGRVTWPMVWRAMLTETPQYEAQRPEPARRPRRARRDG